MTVGIIGVGLLGGSIGYILKKKKWADKVIGIGRSKGKLERAVQLNAVDEYCIGYTGIISEMDIVILCVPVLLIPGIVKEIVPFLKHGAIVTDVGSTKKMIMTEITALLPDGVSFVGGHPMAGSEKTGVEGLDPFLFENAVYVLVKSKLSSDKAYATIKSMVLALDAIILEMNEDDHDFAVSAVSHTPHLIASSLVNCASSVSSDSNHILSLAAGGFRDTTRVASGNPHMWKDICTSNNEKIVQVLDYFVGEINAFKKALQEKDEEALLTLFSNAKAVRDKLPKNRKGILSPMFEVIVFVPDKPGVIGRISNLLGENDINIKDIEVLHVRENEGGSIRLGLDNTAASNKAVEVLRENGYHFTILE